MKRFVLHIVILYGLGVAVGEAGVLVIPGVPSWCLGARLVQGCWLARRSALGFGHPQ